MIRKLNENNEFIYVITREHNHLVDACDVAVMATKAKLKRLADTSREPTRSVVAAALDGQPSQVLASLPLYTSMANTVRRARKGTTKTAPKNLLELEFAGDWCKIEETGEYIVWYDSWSTFFNEEIDEKSSDEGLFIFLCLHLTFLAIGLYFWFFLKDNDDDDDDEHERRIQLGFSRIL